jgi:hypothetical protein
MCLMVLGSIFVLGTKVDDEVYRALRLKLCIVFLIAAPGACVSGQRRRLRNRTALAAGVQSEPDLDPIVLSIEAKLQRAGKGKSLIIENGATIEVNKRLVELIKEAFAIRNHLLSGSDASIEAMSGRIGMNKGRLTSLIRLSYLAPEIVGGLLASRHPIELTPARLLRLSKNLPHDWKEQRRSLGFAA